MPITYVINNPLLSPMTNTIALVIQLIQVQSSFGSK